MAGLASGDRGRVVIILSFVTLALESVMRRVVRYTFTGRNSDLLLHTRSSEPPVRHEPELVAPKYTPQQQIALLMLRRSPLSEAVLKVLHHSTARASEIHFVELENLGLARRKRPPQARWHELLPRGHYIASTLAHELAKEFKITVEPKRHAMFRPGVFSQNGNW